MAAERIAASARSFIGRTSRRKRVCPRCGASEHGLQVRRDRHRLDVEVLDAERVRERGARRGVADHLGAEDALALARRVARERSRDGRLPDATFARDEHGTQAEAASSSESMRITAGACYAVCHAGRTRTTNRGPLPRVRRGRSRGGRARPSARTRPMSERARGAAREGAGLRRDGAARPSRASRSSSRRCAVLGVVHAGCGSDAKELFTRPFDAGARRRREPTSAAPRSTRPSADRAPRTRSATTPSLARSTAATRPSALPERPGRLAVRRPALLQRAGDAASSASDARPAPSSRARTTTRAPSTAASRRRRPASTTRAISTATAIPTTTASASDDCDDLDPDVSSKHSEVCGNFKDDNCNGVVDEPRLRHARERRLRRRRSPVTSRTRDVPALDRRREADYATTSCRRCRRRGLEGRRPEHHRPGRRRRRTSRSGPTAQSSKNEVAVALRADGPDDCGVQVGRGEVGCGHIAGLAVRAGDRARSRGRGSLVYAIVTTQQEGAVDVKVDCARRRAKPTNESCASAPVDVAARHAVHGLAHRSRQGRPERVRQGADGRADVLVHAARPEPGGRADLRLDARGNRTAASSRCATRPAADELRCRVGPVPPLFARGLAPGPHVFTVAGTRQIDASILVKALPGDDATERPELRDGATRSSPNTTIMVDLSAHEDAIKNGCLPGGPTAAYELDAHRSRATCSSSGVSRRTRSGSVSLSGPGCGTADLLVPPCAMGPTPQRVSKRNLPAGQLPRRRGRRARSDGAAHGARAAGGAADGRRRSPTAA